MMSNSKHRALDESYSERMEELYYSKTDEKKILSDLLRKILGNRKFERALDVGAGPGYASKPIVEVSKNVVMVETLPEYENTLKKKYPSAKVIIDSIENVDLKGSFDLILASHMLYYFTPEKWLPLCERLFNSLNKNGLLIIVVMSDKADWWNIADKYSVKLKNYIRFDYIPYSKFRNRLLSIAPIKEYSFDYEVVLNNKEELIKCVGNDVLQINNEDILNKYRDEFAKWYDILERRGEKVLFHATCEVVVLRKGQCIK